MNKRLATALLVLFALIASIVAFFYLTTATDKTEPVNIETQRTNPG